MELEHSFTVPVPRSRAWDVLLDVERVAPCMPGATIDSVEGDEIRGRIKVKVGPINMTYAGTARFIEKDEEAGVVTLEASGKETRGAGTASASVRSVLEDRGEETHVTVHTTLNVTGKPAQFGRGVMNEVGGRLLGIFAANLATTLGEQNGDGEAAQAASAPTDSAKAGAEDTGPAAAGAEPEGADAEAGTGTTAAAETPIDHLKLPARAVSSLRRENLTTAGQVAAKTADELLAIDGIGPASVVDIQASLAALGLELGSSGPAAQPPGTTAPAAPAAATPHTSTARETAHQLEEDAINLLKVAGMPVLKRAIPVVAALAAALVVALRRRVRRRRG
jgi:carbon monoxide dehydrogenase subunit G